jgi:hypothetical protein
MLFLKTKTQLALNVNSSGELGGSRFSCICLAPAIRAQIGAAEVLPASPDNTEQGGKSQLTIGLCNWWWCGQDLLKSQENKFLESIGHDA